MHGWDRTNGSRSSPSSSVSAFSRSTSSSSPSFPSKGTCIKTAERGSLDPSPSPLRHFPKGNAASILDPSGLEKWGKQDRKEGREKKGVEGDSLLQEQNHIPEVLFSHIKYFKSTAGNSSSRSSILRPKLRSRQPSSKAPEGFLLLQNRFDDFQLKLLTKLSYSPILDDNEKADPQVANAQDVLSLDFSSPGACCV